jgi:hypothetical protein
MLVKIVKTTPGSPDGIHVKKYEAGQSYELPENLAQTFVGMGVAEIIIEEVEPEKKSSGAAPQNKSVAPSQTKEDEDEYINKIMDDAKKQTLKKDTDSKGRNRGE